MISLWPARGGPVLADGVIYFAAGIWLGEGIFVHALDADTGRVIWSNGDSGLLPEANLDHGVKSVASLSPQGYLAVVGDSPASWQAQSHSQQPRGLTRGLRRQVRTRRQPS